MCHNPETPAHESHESHKSHKSKCELYPTLYPPTQLNSHAAFPAKQGNYSENKERWAKEGGNDDGDGAVLREEGKELTGEEQAGATAFLNCVVEGLGLRGVMEANYKQHYGSDDKSASARMMVFDGDYFRRVFHLLLASDEGKRGDVLAYMQVSSSSSSSSS